MPIKRVTTAIPAALSRSAIGFANLKRTPRPAPKAPGRLLRSLPCSKKADVGQKPKRSPLSPAQQNSRFGIVARQSPQNRNACQRLLHADVRLKMGRRRMAVPPPTCSRAWSQYRRNRRRYHVVFPMESERESTSTEKYCEYYSIDKNVVSIITKYSKYLQRYEHLYFKKAPRFRIVVLSGHRGFD